MCEDTEKLSGDPVSGQEDTQDAGRHCAWLAPLILYLILPVCGIICCKLLFRHALPMQPPDPVKYTVFLPQPAVSAGPAAFRAEATTVSTAKPVPVRLGEVYETMSDAAELDLSGINVCGLDMDSFLNALPMLSRIVMHGCGLDNDGYAALQDAHPDVKIVWDIDIQSYTVSTDAVGFSTLLANEKQPRLTNDDAKYLKYCTEMVALDLGHNHISDLSFLQYMPRLRVLILADNCTKDGSVLLSDISPLKYVPHLRYLELFANNISDFSVLSELTELEDLNICYNPFSTTKDLKNLPSLQRLWVYANYVPQEELAALQSVYPDAVVVISGEGSIDQGWRDSPHYYAMRNMVINNVIDDLYRDELS